MKVTSVVIREPYHKQSFWTVLDNHLRMELLSRGACLSLWSTWGNQGDELALACCEAYGFHPRVSASVLCPSANTLLKVILQQYQTFSCSLCKQPVKALIKAGITLQTGSFQLCYSVVLLRSEENICTWQRNCSSQIHLYFGTELQWPLKGRAMP